VAFVDADDALAPEALSMLFAALEHDQSAQWCTTDVVWVTGEDVTAQTRQIIPARLPGNLYYGILCDNDTEGPGGNIGRPFFFRRDALVAVGMFDEQMKAREDWELPIRMIHNDMLPKYVKGGLYLHHVGTGGLTRNRRLILDNSDRVMQKHHKILADKGDGAAARIYAKNLWDLGRQYLYEQRDVWRALSCAIRSLKYDFDLSRLFHPIYNRLSGGRGFTMSRPTD
jgi:hypothetical protein